MDPDVEWYCEYPMETTVFVGGAEEKVLFDVWVRYHDGAEEFQGITYTSKEGERKKIALQAKWCIQNGMKFEFRNEKNIQKGPFHIRNLSVLASRARRFRVSSVNAAQMTVKFMADTGRATISELEECGFFETGRTLDYLANLAKRPCGVKVWDGWKELIIPEYFICNNGSDRGFDIYRLNRA